MTLHQYKIGARPSPCLMICSQCERVLGCVKSQRVGTWLGPRAQLFGYSHFDDAWRGSHHSSDGSFFTAVSERCYICFIIHRDFAGASRERLSKCCTFFELRRDGHNRFSIKFSVELYEDPTNNTVATRVVDCLGTFKVFPRRELPTVGARLRITDNTWTEECQTQIQEWLNSCVKTHELCRHDAHPPPNYAMRLLRIEPGDVTRVRLETIEIGTPQPKYVTLSHCWNHGRPSKFQLTTKNRTLLEASLPTSELPQKFQHATDIAKWMGINYIWIDAMCIMQDSKQDWLSQAQNVGNIYSRSYCNIAATNGDEGDQEAGLLGARHVDIVEPSFVPNPDLDQHELDFILAYDDIWCNSLLATRLHSRGWVLQERLLSPRTIHFGQEQFFFECRELKACEAYPDGLPERLCNWRTDAWRKGESLFRAPKLESSFWDIFGRASNLGPKDLADAHDFWSSTVMRYMDCELSYDEDKLIAISGLAGKVGRHTKERYLAGLWEGEQLAQSLLWYVPTQSQADGSASRRLPPLNRFDYRAPSWSWASMDARITWNWPANCGQSLMDIERTDVRSRDFGAIEAAEMHVRASILPIKIQIPSVLEDGTPDESGSYLIQLQGKGEEPSKGLPVLQAIVYLDVAMDVRESDAWLMPVCTKWEGRTGGISTAVAGLLLKKSSHVQGPNYERIGIVGLDEQQARTLCAFHGITRGGGDGLQRLQRDRFVLI